MALGLGGGYRACWRISSGRAFAGWHGLFRPRGPLVAVRVLDELPSVFPFREGGQQRGQGVESHELAARSRELVPGAPAGAGSETSGLHDGQPIAAAR